MATTTTTTKATKATKATTTKATTKATKAPAVKATKAGDLTAYILAEVGQRIGSKFYKRALSYHADAATVFPRARTAATRAALTQADVEETMRQHDANVLAPGNAKGQAIFDVYMTLKG